MENPTTGGLKSNLAEYLASEPAAGILAYYGRTIFCLTHPSGPDMETWQWTGPMKSKDTYVHPK